MGNKAMNDFCSYCIEEKNLSDVVVEVRMSVGGMYFH